MRDVRGCFVGITIPIQEIIDLYEKASLTLDELSNKYGISSSCIWQKLRKAGFHVRSRKEALNLPNTRQKKGLALLGKPGGFLGHSFSHSEEAKRKIRLASLGRPCWTKGLTKETDERVRRMSESKRGNPSNFRGKHHTSLAKEKNRKKHLELLKDPEYLKKILTCRKPNNSEVKLLDIIKAYGFVFVGDGKLIIEGRNPDFVDCSKHKIIELFGRRWHEPEEATKSIEFFKRHGYDALVIWEEELKNDDLLIFKIEVFLGLPKNFNGLSMEAVQRCQV